MLTIGDYAYNVDDKLGEGAFGVVYKGHTIQNSTEIVAIKVLDLKKGNNSKMQPGVIDREINILKDLSQQSHPNFVTLRHCEKRADNVYLVMEFYSGGDLRKYLEMKGPLDEATIKRFLKQIVNGVKFMRQKNIVHRDLKPENILISSRGNGTTKDITLKIADFGLGKYLPPGVQTGTFCGTWVYMAPEILETLHRNQPYDASKVDMYSVGVLAYHFLTGRLTERPDLDTMILPPSTSQDLSDLLTGLLQTDPSNRFDIDTLSRHRFLGSSIFLSVNGPSGTKIMHTNDNASVDDVINIVASAHGLAAEADSIYLVHEGRPISRGSNGSIEDAGIINGSQIQFCQRQRGGRTEKETV